MLNNAKNKIIKLTKAYYLKNKFYYIDNDHIVYEIGLVNKIIHLFSSNITSYIKTTNNYIVIEDNIYFLEEAEQKLLKCKENYIYL